MHERATSDPALRAQDLFSTACCVTLVQGLSTAETFARLDADTSCSATIGFPELVRRAYGDLGHDSGTRLLGAAQLTGWSLVLEPNGFACTDRQRVRAASRGTTVVTSYRSGDAHELTVTTNGRRRHFYDLAAAPGRLDPDEREAVLVERLSGVWLSTALLARLRYRTCRLDDRASEVRRSGAAGRARARPA